MPYGNLRENGNNRKRADLILVTKTPEEITESSTAVIMKELKPHQHQKIFFTSISYRDLTPLFESSISKSYRLSEKNSENYGAVLITGIAVPDLLAKFIGKYFKETIHLNFPDHHYFGEKDIEKIKTAWKSLRSQEKILITTEKDAVRLREFTNIEDSLKRVFYYIPVGVSFLKNEQHEFDNLIFEYVRKNKRDSRVP
jgi:tetraacyldisaccharide 4'-kinase